MPPNLKEQALEIERLCREAGLSPEAMAEKAAVKAESMRKIIKGYQPCSPQLMQSFRNIAEMEQMGLSLNREFERLFEKSGWTMEKAARELGIPVAQVRNILGGGARPDAVVVRSFKLRVGDIAPMPMPMLKESAAAPGASHELEGWERELIGELRQLEPGDRRKAVQGLRTILSMLPKRPR